MEHKDKINGLPKKLENEFLPLGTLKCKCKEVLWFEQLQGIRITRVSYINGEYVSAYCPKCKKYYNVKTTK